MTKIDLPPFNPDYWMTQLKKEVGLMEVPYDELGKYEVDLDSPFGRGKIKINAKEYVDQQLAIIEEDYRITQNGEGDDYLEDVDVVLSSNEPVLLVAAPVQEIKEDSIKFYNVVINEVPYVVFVNTTVRADDEKWIITDQINTITNDKRFYKGETFRHFLTGLETAISYYQYVDKVSSIPRAQEPLTAYEMINERMDTVFDSLKVNWDVL